MTEKNWHPNFIEYMEMIVEHPNYNGLPIEKKHNGEYKWVTTKKTSIGKERINWALNKALELGIKNGPGVYAKVMFEIHPTKKKTCQICGQDMFLRYIYPNVNLVKFLIKEYNYYHDTFDTIYDINDFLKNKGLSEQEVINFYIRKLKLKLANSNLSLSLLVDEIEEKCRAGIINTFGPGAMSNFPDRFDGFHSYNRCCRSSEDKGRSKDNLKSYGKDRRAYEYWSDGNIHAANKFMTSPYFKGLSADHIGPISLGFIHDSRFIQPMSSGDNSSKRDRLDISDFQKLIQLEKQLNVCPVSWFAAKIWNELKIKYTRNELVLENARICLKINMVFFMEILWEISQIKNNNGQIFLTENFLIPKIEYFKYNYSFNSNGEILQVQQRHITDATKKEFNRFLRISFEAIEDFHNKENRNINIKLPLHICLCLDKLKISIEHNPGFKLNLNKFISLINYVQDYIIQNHLSIDN